ncbi:MAG TPA: AAA family ATPase [Methanoregulaceae archaeon]|nr:AAA family ATPase [Methanoregulaceae archaeon]
MLWIEKYRPVLFDEIIGQENVIGHLKSFSCSKVLPHLLLSGPHGTGKSVAVECIARLIYGDQYRENCTVLNASDLFMLGKRYLEDDERFIHLYRKDQSLISNFKNIVRWSASLQPFGTSFRMMVIDDASALTREAQSSLRRTMERYSRTCRFVFCTTQSSALIPAISSRCLPFFFGPIRADVAASHLRSILARENPERCCSDDEIDLIVQESGGDFRRALMLLQVASESGEKFDLSRFRESETEMVAQAVCSAIIDRDGQAANRRIESLVIEYGLSANEVLRELRKVMRREYNDPRIAEEIARTDYLIGHGNNEFIQLNALAARLIDEVF